MRRKGSQLVVWPLVTPCGGNKSEGFYGEVFCDIIMNFDNYGSRKNCKFLYVNSLWPWSESEWSGDSGDGQEVHASTFFFFHSIKSLHVFGFAGRGRAGEKEQLIPLSRLASDLAAKYTPTKKKESKVFPLFSLSSLIPTALQSQSLDAARHHLDILLFALGVQEHSRLFFFLPFSSLYFGVQIIIKPIVLINVSHSPIFWLH